MVFWSPPIMGGAGIGGCICCIIGAVGTGGGGIPGC